MKLQPKPIYNENSDLIRIEFYDSESGVFEIEAVWDERDDQTEDNQEAFTKWAYNHMRDRGDDVVL
jgi:hypothetical protein